MGDQKGMHVVKIKTFPFILGRYDAEIVQTNGSYGTSRRLLLNELILPRILNYKPCDHHLFEVLLVTIQVQKPLFLYFEKYFNYFLTLVFSCHCVGVGLWHLMQTEDK